MVARQHETIIPFYFGNDQQRLFGCYHGMAASDSDCGFVLCYPFGYEYFRAHAAYRQLAKRLSANGFPVLRFDFYCCGDSSGEFQDARLGDWTGNVHSAIDELKRRSGRSSICVLGSRLSGAISLMAIVARDDIHRMVLWDPVILGQPYIRELETRHRRMLRISHVALEPGSNSESVQELLGYPISNSLRKEIEGIDLTLIELPSDAEMLLISSNPTKAELPFRDHLQTAGIRLQYKHLPNPELWDWVENVGNALLPMDILQQITNWSEQAV